MTIKQAAALIEQTKQDARNKFPANDTGSYYDRKHYLSQVLRQLLQDVGDSLPYQTRHYVQSQLEVAQHTGD